MSNIIPTFADEAFRDSLVKTSDELRVSKEVKASFKVWLILEDALYVMRDIVTDHKVR